jgi:NAD(P)-dependent dehydrogenase (short-subunit alcohol dehydrogenase family)
MAQPRLQGKVAIVTGGASGFGKGIVHKFIAEGASVLIADLSSDAGNALVSELGPSAHFLRADVTSRDDWALLLQTAIDKFGGLDIVVNNAGASYANKATEEVTEKDFDLVMNVNVKSIWLSTNVLLPYFLGEKGQARKGCFIQVASTAGVRPRGRLTWYNASKAAVINATKVCPSHTLRLEKGP